MCAASGFYTQYPWARFLCSLPYLPAWSEKHTEPLEPWAGRCLKEHRSLSQAWKSCLHTRNTRLGVDVKPVGLHFQVTCDSSSHFSRVHSFTVWGWVEEACAFALWQCSFDPGISEGNNFSATMSGKWVHSKHFVSQDFHGFALDPSWHTLAPDVVVTPRSLVF